MLRFPPVFFQQVITTNKLFSQVWGIFKKCSSFFQQVITYDFFRRFGEFVNFFLGGFEKIVGLGKTFKTRRLTRPPDAVGEDLLAEAVCAQRSTLIRAICFGFNIHYVYVVSYEGNSVYIEEEKCYVFSGQFIGSQALL